MTKFKLNKKIMKISSLNENEEKEFWHSRSPIERLKAIETYRRIIYGYAHTTPRFQRFFEVAEFKKS